MQLQLADGNGWTAAHAAARRGHCSVLQLLYELKVDTDVRDDCGWAPLHIAISKGTTEASNFMIARCSDINVTGPAGWTPLHMACYVGRAIARFLLSSTTPPLEAL